MVHNFFWNMAIEVDMKEIKFPVGIGLPVFRTADGVEKIYRTITTKDLMDWWAETKQTFPKSDFGGLISDESRTMIYASVGDIKAECVLFDASYLKALGYTKVWFEDRTPGDTSISYIMWGEK